MKDILKEGYAGSEWIKSMFPYWYKKQPMEMSELGEKVADLLGELFYGIYHLEDTPLTKVEWDNNHHITVSIDRSLSTYDNSDLTRLVLLCHLMRLRVEVRPANFSHIHLFFVNRSDNHEDRYKYHPSIDEAVQNFKSNVSIEVMA